jgi:hypothetical protein
MFVIVAVAACNKPEQKQVEQPRTNQDQEALVKADNKIRELSAELGQLKIENERLRAKNERLAYEKDIQPRVQQLIACYGTGIWDYGEDSDYPVFAKSMKGAGVREVIVGLNERFKKYKQPAIRLKKKENSTVFIDVDNEEQLSQQMGSTGALAYMTAVTYSLISVKGIDCVYFDIGEGEHAGPGKYCKDSL